MWGIEFSPAVSRIELPLATKESIVAIAGALLSIRIIIQLVIEKLMGVQGIRKEHNPNTLEYSYFYHLCIIVLVLPDLNWNIFDLTIWISSYVLVGMIRKAIYVLNAERSFLLNDYSYNCKIITLLKGSQMFAVLFGTMSVIWILWAHISFLGVAIRVLSLLIFPSILLIVDSVFLFLISAKTRQNLIYYYNQNINGDPPLLQLQLYHKIVGSAIRIWHFVNLSLLCFFMIYEKIDFLDCLWVVSAIGAFYTSSVQLVSSVAKYKKSQKLTSAINGIITRGPTSVERICIICMEPLLNSYELNACQHKFHYKCLYQWIQTKQQCPVCRIRINIQI